MKSLARAIIFLLPHLVYTPCFPQAKTPTQAYQAISTPDFGYLPTYVARAKGFFTDERLDLIDALAGFTVGSAWVNHLERETGSLEVGKAADLAVIDRDLFDRGAGAIGDARVVGTFIDGVAVVEDPALDG